MTPANLHYLIGWAGAVIIIVSAIVGLTISSLHESSDDEKENDGDA